MTAETRRHAARGPGSGAEARDGREPEMRTALERTDLFRLTRRSPMGKKLKPIRSGAQPLTAPLELYQIVVLGRGCNPMQSSGAVSGGLWRREPRQPSLGNPGRLRAVDRAEPGPDASVSRDPGGRSAQSRRQHARLRRTQRAA